MALIIPSAKRPSTSKIFEVIVQETLKLVKGCRPCNWGCLVQKLVLSREWGLLGWWLMVIINMYRSCPHSLCLAPVRKSVGNYPLAKGRSFRRPEVVPLEDWRRLSDWTFRPDCLNQQYEVPTNDVCWCKCGPHQLDRYIPIYIYIHIYYVYLCLFIYLYISIIYVYIYIYIYIYIYMYIYICIYIYISISVYLYISISLYLYISISLYLYISISLYLDLYIDIHIFGNSYLYIYISISQRV